MRTVIATTQAPQAIGPYSQAIRAGNLLFCSGQIALDSDGNMVGPGDVETQTRQVLDNLAAVLGAGGASFESVTKTTIYLLRMEDFAVVNGIYAERFTAQPPARATVAVSQLPKSALVEVDAIAIVS